MMREVIRYQIQCTVCGRGAGEPTELWTDAWLDASRQGWTLVHGRNGEHVCPQCQAERARSEGGEH